MASWIWPKLAPRVRPIEGAARLAVETAIMTRKAPPRTVARTSQRRRVLERAACLAVWSVSPTAAIACVTGSMRSAVCSGGQRLLDCLSHDLGPVPLRPVAGVVHEAQLGAAEQAGEMKGEIGVEVRVARAEHQRDGRVERRQVAGCDVTVLLVERRVQ